MYVRVKPKTYKNKNEWYYPEIDYHEMMQKFWLTSTRMDSLIGGRLPRNMLMLMDFSGAFNPEEKDQQIFQFWNRQFNDQLAATIEQLAKGKPKLILDPCAGDGTLAKILTDRGFNVKAVDTYEWPFKERYFKGLERMDYKEAIKKYKPDFIIGCWMPLWSDWTKDFRRFKSVKNYIIIGEGDGGCTGGDWKERKGWRMEYEENPSHYGICRTDHFYRHDDERDSGIRHTQVYSFSRL